MIKITTNFRDDKAYTSIKYNISKGDIFTEITWITTIGEDKSNIKVSTIEIDINLLLDNKKYLNVFLNEHYNDRRFYEEAIVITDLVTDNLSSLYSPTH